MISLSKLLALLLRVFLVLPEAAAKPNTIGGAGADLATFNTLAGAVFPEFVVTGEGRWILQRTGHFSDMLQQ